MPVRAKGVAQRWERDSLNVKLEDQTYRGMMLLVRYVLAMFYRRRVASQVRAAATRLWNTT